MGTGLALCEPAAAHASYFVWRGVLAMNAQAISVNLEQSHIIR
jgi:hypothetical protein